MTAAPTTVNGGRVARNTTYLTLALLGQKVLSALYIPVVAVLIGPSAIGEYLGALSFINIFAIFVDLGLLPAFIRQVARDPTEGKNEYNIIITFKILMAVVVSGALAVTVYIFSKAGLSHPASQYLVWAAIGMAIDAITATGYGFFRGLQRLEFESVGTVLHRVVVMLVGLLALHLGAPPIVVIIALVAGSTANFLYVSFHLWRQGMSWRPKWDTTVMKRLLKIAFPFAVAALFTALYANSDTFLLQIFKTHRDVGLYGTASKMAIAFQIVPAALVGAIYPAMSAAFINDRKKLQRLFLDAMRYLIIVFVPIMVVIILLAHPLVLLLYKKVWIDAVWPLRILSIGLPFLFLHYPIGYLLNAANRQTRNTWNIAITVLVNIGLNLIFIRQYSYYSVAIISVCTSLLLFSLGFYYARKTIQFPIRELLFTFGKTIAAGLILGAIGLGLLAYTKNMSGVFFVAATLGAVYLVLLFVFQIISRQDVEHLAARIRRS